MYQEVYTTGLKKRVAEIPALQEMFAGGLIQVLPELREGPDELESSGLHAGEISVIRAAISFPGTAIMDDKRARKVARSIGVNLAGTGNILIELVRRGAISKSQAKDGIDMMIEDGWYCSAKDYMHIMDAISGQSPSTR